jgi:arabinoxylan arabinofuranohydrolase
VELAEKPRNIDYGADNLNKEMCDFGEGVWVFKKEGIYYFTYTNFKNPKQQGFYTMEKSPYGPFEYKGPMAPAPIGAQDHHSMVKFQEHWYYFYHTSYYNNAEWPQGEVHNRAISLDRLNFNPDGTLQMVKETKVSIAPSAPSRKRSQARWGLSSDDKATTIASGELC